MRISIAILLIAALSSISARAKDGDTPYISVTGTATTEVVPDLMIWNLTVKNTGPELLIVAQEHTKILHATLDFLKQAEIQESEIQTSCMSFGENWVRKQKNEDYIQDGYYASTNLSFRTSDLDKYQMLWIGLSKIEGLTLDDVDFDHSKRIELQKETQRKALLDAQEKAIGLAKTLGGECGEPLAIVESPSVDYLGYYGRHSSNDDDDDSSASDYGTTLMVGQMKIRMKIAATFRLIDANAKSAETAKSPSIK